jgi:hypothetical protein
MKSKKITEQQAKEHALIVAVLIREDILKGSVFFSFDKCWEIAKDFVEKYPPDTKWGIGEGFDEYDETVIDFAKQYLNNNSKNR